MEYVNKILLQGIVGMAKAQTINGRKVTKFTLAVNYATKAAEGTPIIETQWFNVAAFEGPGIAREEPQKGDAVRVLGRLRTQRYLAPDGTDRTTTEVVAHELNIIEKNVYGL